MPGLIPQLLHKLDDVSPSLMLTGMMVAFVLSGMILWFALIRLLDSRWGRRVLLAVAIHVVILFGIQIGIWIGRYHLRSVEQPAQAIETSPNPSLDRTIRSSPDSPSDAPMRFIPIPSAEH